MADDPFCYHLKSALAHLRGAINEMNDALAMPACRLLRPQHRHALQTMRHKLSRQHSNLRAILPTAVDATYVQGKLPDNVLDTLKTANQIIEITKSDNAEPPSPE